MNIWRLITHHIPENKNAVLRWTRENERIAIGWGKIGHIGERGYHSVSDVKDAIRAVPEYAPFRNSGTGGPSLWNLFAEVQPGDLVVLNAYRPRALVVEVVGNYEWTQHNPPPQVGQESDYWHQRQVRLTNLDSEAVHRAAGGGPTPGQSVYLTLFRYPRSLSPADL